MMPPVSVWITPSWWAYVLALPGRYDEPLGWAYNSRLLDYANRVWCRVRNHPAGMIYYNPGGHEPNSTCKNCGDDLG